MNRIILYTKEEINCFLLLGIDIINYEIKETRIMKRKKKNFKKSSVFFVESFTMLFYVFRL